jgi:uncharacterized membrane protein YphA (DoxX/SURF4 family)
MKVLIVISRLFAGLIFSFSGFVKSVDPVGTEIKFHDYFEAMGLDFLSPYALLFSFLMNGAEFIIGFMLIINVFPKLSGWAALLFMSLFTPLTLWLAIANPVTDCGCFGDAVKLTNWQTFWKNIVILIVVFFFVISTRKTIILVHKKRSIFLSGTFIVLVFGFEFYNFYNLPLIDFLPFKKGVNIKDASTVPENAPQDVYETNIYYKNLKSGEIKAFTIENIPYEDTLNWTFDTTITKLIKKGYEPPINDFFLTNLNQEDITEQILNYKGLSYIIVMHDMEKAVPRVEKHIHDIGKFTDEHSIPFYCFTSSGSAIITKFMDTFPKNLIVCTADYKMLKTMLRSNPGFIILKDAVIIDKFHYLNIPDTKHLPK